MEEMAGRRVLGSLRCCGLGGRSANASLCMLLTTQRTIQGRRLDQETDFHGVAWYLVVPALYDLYAHCISWRVIASSVYLPVIISRAIH